MPRSSSLTCAMACSSGEDRCRRGPGGLFGQAESVDDAKARLLERWREWLAWAELQRSIDSNHASTRFWGREGAVAGGRVERAAGTWRRCEKFSSCSLAVPTPNPSQRVSPGLLRNRRGSCRGRGWRIARIHRARCVLSRAGSLSTAMPLDRISGEAPSTSPLAAAQDHARPPSPDR